VWLALTNCIAVTLLQQEIAALEELSRQLFLEVVDLHGVKVCSDSAHTDYQWQHWNLLNILM